MGTNCGMFWDTGLFGEPAMLQCLLKFNLEDIFMEARYRCFVAPHKYFNGVAAVCIVAHSSAHVHACSQDLHVTFSELSFGNA